MTSQCENFLAFPGNVINTKFSNASDAEPGRRSTLVADAASVLAERWPDDSVPRVLPSSGKSYQSLPRYRLWSVYEGSAQEIWLKAEVLWKITWPFRGPQELEIVLVMWCLWAEEHHLQRLERQGFGQMRATPSRLGLPNTFREQIFYLASTARQIKDETFSFIII